MAVGPLIDISIFAVLGLGLDIVGSSGVIFFALLISIAGIGCSGVIFFPSFDLCKKFSIAVIRGSASFILATLGIQAGRRVVKPGVNSMVI